MADTPSRLRDILDGIWVAGVIAALAALIFYAVDRSVLASALFDLAIWAGLSLNFTLPERVLNYQPQWIVWAALIAFLLFTAWPIAVLFIALTVFRFAARAWRERPRATPARTERD